MSPHTAIDIDDTKEEGGKDGRQKEEVGLAVPTQGDDPCGNDDDAPVTWMGMMIISLIVSGTGGLFSLFYWYHSDPIKFAQVGGSLVIGEFGLAAALTSQRREKTIINAMIATTIPIGIAVTGFVVALMALLQEYIRQVTA